VCVVMKMRIHEDCEVGDLMLDATREERVAAVFEQEKAFCVGRVKSINLGLYAVSILFKLGIHEDCVVEILSLYARKEVAAVLEQYQTLCVERVKTCYSGIMQFVFS
ncbi:MAG: uncharacterized protein A8A55_3596, partial [Amphiamblys sp. WSBS2006]